MLILRVEKKDGSGVYRDRYIGTKLQHMYDSGEINGTQMDKLWDIFFHNNPTPASDPLMKKKWWGKIRKGKTDNYLFGFRNIQEVSNWFPKECRFVLPEDTILCTYEVPDPHVLYGLGQVAFHRKKAKVVKKDPFHETVP